MSLEVERSLEAYLIAWNRFMDEGRDEDVRAFFLNSFRGFWSAAGMDHPETYGRDYDMESVRDRLKGSKFRIEQPRILMRKGGSEAVLSGVEYVTHGANVHAAHVMMVWRKEEGKWKLLREYVETQG